MAVWGYWVNVCAMVKKYHTLRLLLLPFQLCGVTGLMSVPWGAMVKILRLLLLPFPFHPLPLRSCHSRLITSSYHHLC